MNQREECNQVITTIFKVLDDGSRNDYIGEKISQLAHSLQAAQLAREGSKYSRKSDNGDDEQILAALLHDIGQFASFGQGKQMILDTAELLALDNTINSGSASQVSVGVHGHERIGADYLRKLGFSETIAQLVESHVAVKRYLTGKSQEYYDTLSAASKMSLKYQGGPFTKEEVAAFEADPLFEKKVQLRKWDDGAKIAGWQVPELESYREMGVKHLMQQRQAV